MRPGILLIGLCWIATGTASAQRLAQHRGFWISPSVSYVLTHSDPLYERAGETAESGLGLSLRLGGSPSQRLLLGAELSGWGAGRAIFRGHTAFTALYYLSGRGGAFLDGALGLATRIVSYTVITSDQVLELDESDSGLGLAAGMGYDIQLGRNFFVTPRFQIGLQYLADHWAPTVALALGTVWH